MMMMLWPKRARAIRLTRMASHSGRLTVIRGAALPLLVTLHVKVGCMLNACDVIIMEVTESCSTAH